MIPGHVNTGQPIQFPADFYNLLTDLARQAVQQQITNILSDAASLPFGLVRIKNASGANRDVLDVLYVTGSEIDTTAEPVAAKTSVCLTGGSVTSVSGDFAILAHPIPTGSFGVAFVSGAFPARINVADANHTRADWKASDSTQLQSCTNGRAKILYKESGTGTKLAIVRMCDTGICDMRWNSTTHKIQVCYVGNPAEADWIDKVTFTGC